MLRTSPVIRAIGAVALACAFAAGLTAAAAQTASIDPGALSATAVYDNARKAVAALALPPYLAYTADFTFDRKGRVEAEHERILLRTSDGHALVRRVPDSARDRVDTTPRVVTQGAKDDPATALPLTTFGLRPRKSGGEFLESPASPEPAPSDAGVIGSVRVVDRAYDVSSAGTAAIDGRSVYHLLLVPKRDPAHNRIRELFVDAQTFVPLRYVIEVTASAGPIHKSFPVTCDTALVGTYRLITRAQASVAVRALFFSVAGTGRYELRDISFPAELPQWLFDAAAMNAHAGEPIPN